MGVWSWKDIETMGLFGEKSGFARVSRGEHEAWSVVTVLSQTPSALSRSLNRMRSIRSRSGDEQARGIGLSYCPYVCTRQSDDQVWISQPGNPAGVGLLARKFYQILCGFYVQVGFSPSFV